MSGQVERDVNHRLMTAIRNGSLETVSEIINCFGLSYSKAWSNGYILLCYALKWNKAAVAVLLIERGAKINNKISLLKPPLHYAAKNGEKKIVKMILDKGADIDAKDDNGKTALLLSIECNEIEITVILLQHGADVNTSKIDVPSPLHFAVKAGNVQLVKDLLKYGAHVNCVYTSFLKNNYTPLHSAVESGIIEVVMLLIDRGANLDAKVQDNMTALHIATEKGIFCISKILLDHGACTNSLTMRDGYTPLHFASRQDDDKAVKLFLDRGADINAGTKETPLHIAIRYRSIRVVKLLLQRGARVDNEDKDGKTTLHVAVENGYSSIVKDILNHNPDINNQSNKDSLRAALIGSKKEHINIMEDLLEYGLNFNIKDANNAKLIDTAVEKGCLIATEKLLKLGADVNLQYLYSSNKGFSLLHTAAKNKRAEVVKLLISYGADINAQDSNGKTPLYYAIQNVDSEITKLLSTNQVKVKDIFQLLLFAIKKGSKEIVEALLQHDADINATDENGRTALHFTCSSERGYLMYDIIHLLGWDVHDDNSYSEECGGEIAKLLLSKGANVDAQTKKGKTALEAAIESNNEKVVEALLEYNANVNSVSGSNTTPLHCSALKKNKKICLMLLKKGANVHAKQKCGITALHIASQGGNIEVINLLLKYGAQVDCKTFKGITPLHLCADKGHTKAIKTILKNGANIDSRDGNGRTALHIASYKGHKDVVVTLLKYGSDNNITCIKNHTPLDYALVGLSLFYNRNIYSNDPDDDVDNDYNYMMPQVHGISPCELTAKALNRYIIKTKSAKLYVSKKNLQSMSVSLKIVGLDLDYQCHCEEEIAHMKSKKIINPNISFYDILVKGTSSLAIYMRNEKILQALESGDYKAMFPKYANMIENQFRKGIERRDLLEQGINVFPLLFPDLPYDCTQNLLSYLSNEDFKQLLKACKFE